MRTSKNEIKDGIVKNGFDYSLQVWVLDYKIQPSKTAGVLAGKDIRDCKISKADINSKPWNLKTTCLQCDRHGLKEGERMILEGIEGELSSYIAHCNRQECRDKYARYLHKFHNDIWNEIRLKI